MASWESWVQTVCVVVSLLISGQHLRYAGESIRDAADAKRKDAEARADTNLIALTQLHQNLWLAIRKDPDLKRISRKSVDLSASPVTQEEEDALIVIIVQYQLGWNFARKDEALTDAAFAKDVRGYFSRPIPNAVWNSTKENMDTEFVKFVEDALEGDGKTANC